MGIYYCRNCRPVVFQAADGIRLGEYLPVLALSAIKKVLNPFLRSEDLGMRKAGKFSIADCQRPEIRFPAMSF